MKTSCQTRNGTLTSLRSAGPIANAQISLQYRASPEEEWHEMAVVSTDQSGAFLYTWTPAAVGTYSVRALWNGDSDHSRISGEASLYVKEAPAGPGAPGIPGFPIEAIVLGIAVATVYLLRRKRLAVPTAPNI